MFMLLLRPNRPLPITIWLRGNWVFVIYNYDSNDILYTVLPNHQGISIQNACTTCFTKLQRNFYDPKLHILKDRFSEDLKAYFQKYQVSLKNFDPS